MEVLNGSTFNISADENQHPYSLASISIISLIVIIIIIVTVIGNILVVLAYIRDPHLRANVGNLFIVNLAITDFTVGAFSLTLNLSRFIKGFWPHGEVLCKLWIVFDSTVCWVSMITMVLISWDRYCLVRMGLKYKTYQTKKRVGMILIFVWTIAISLHSSLAFAWIPITGQRGVDYTEACRMELLSNVYYTVFINLISFAILLSIAIILNLYVYINIRRRSRGRSTVRHIMPPNIRSEFSTQNLNQITKELPGGYKIKTYEKSQPPESTNNVENHGKISTISNNEIVSLNKVEITIDENKKRMNLAGHRKAAIVLCILTGCFVLFWTPYKVTTVVFSICGTDCISTVTWEVLEVLAWCNSTINPFIYAATNVHFRRNFSQFLLFNRWARNVEH